MASQKGCYASELGDCAGGMSREHYFSEAMSGVLWGKGLEVEGFPWQKLGEKTTVTSAALKAKILCRKHNTALSPLDSAAGSFFQTIYTCIRGGVQGLIPIDNLRFEFDGRVLERWLLKVLCGVLASGNHSGKTRDVPKDWVEILYERRPWPKEFEFYLIERSDYIVPLHDHFRFEFYREGPQEIIKGVTCHFMAYNMSLSLGQFTGFPGVRRHSPRMEFGFRNEERELVIKLRWSEDGLTSG
jgi:hypothetical protein